MGTYNFSFYENLGARATGSVLLNSKHDLGEYLENLIGNTLCMLYLEYLTMVFLCAFFIVYLHWNHIACSFYKIE